MAFQQAQNFFGYYFGNNQQANAVVEQQNANYYFFTLECVNSDGIYSYYFGETRQRLEIYIERFAIENQLNVRLIDVFNIRETSNTTVHSIRSYLKENVECHTEGSFFERPDEVYDWIVSHPHFNIDFEEVDIGYHIEFDGIYEEEFDDEISDGESSDDEDNDPTWEP